jgi:hypothetical protein
MSKSRGTGILPPSAGGRRLAAEPRRPRPGSLNCRLPLKRDGLSRRGRTSATGVPLRSVLHQPMESESGHLALGKHHISERETGRPLSSASGTNTLYANTEPYVFTSTRALVFLNRS